MIKRNAHKFNAVKTVIDGHTFASKAEAARYAELKLLRRAGEIFELELQPKYPIVVLNPEGDHVSHDARVFSIPASLFLIAPSNFDSGGQNVSG